MENDYLTRKAHLDDVKAMHGLLLACAQKGLLLPRALIYLYGHIRNFLWWRPWTAKSWPVAPWHRFGRIWERSVPWWCVTICAVRAWGGGWSRPALVSAANCI